MLFNSYIFTFVFLPLCLIGYFGLNHFRQYQLAQLFLLIMSLWFYGYFNPSYLIIIVASILINYLLTRIMEQMRNPILRKSVVTLAVLLNLGILFYFKYYDFFLVNVNRIFHTDFTLKNILLPLGISFFTFQQVSYVIDAYRGEVSRYGFLQYASFVAYFPQLIAGPIVTHDELIPQFMDKAKKKFNWDNFAQGMYMFAMGLAKKVLIADMFGNAANVGFADPALLDTTNAILTSLAYTIQIYFDFSGYCDMAIGIGKMMNITLPVNFDSPYKALTINEFWSRWHKTLTRFFTRYIYIPLGGNRKGKLRTYINIMIVFLASGIWHGANYTFILWGIFHGLFQIISRHWKERFSRMHPALSWLITFQFVNLTWILFRADSVTHAITFLKRILSMEFGPINPEILKAFLLPEFTLICKYLPGFDFLLSTPGIWLLFFFSAALILCLSEKNAHDRMLEYRPSVGNLLFTWILLIWCVLSFSGVSTFLYFNF